MKARISFFLDSRKGSKTSTIFMYLFLNGEKQKMTTSIKIEEKYWSYDEYKIKLSGKNSNKELAVIVNPQLEEKKNHAEKILKDYKPKNAKDWVFIIKNGYSEVGSEVGAEEKPRYVVLYERFLKEWETSINPKTGQLISGATMELYKLLLKTLQEFEIYQNKKNIEERREEFKIDLRKINQDFFIMFRNYIIKEKGNSPNTFSRNIKELKTFLNWVEGLETEEMTTKFRKFSAPQSYGDVDSLTSKELMELWKIEHKPKSLYVFLALCSTGMRLSDYNRVMTDMDKYIFPSNKGDVLRFRSQKTKQLSTIPLKDGKYFKLYSLYKQFNGKMPKGNETTVNKYLKEKLGFKRFDVTTKIGRKTFCSIRHFEMKMGSQFVMRMSGHSTEAEFMKYLGINPEDIIQAVDDAEGEESYQQANNNI